MKSHAVSLVLCFLSCAPTVSEPEVTSETGSATHDLFSSEQLVQVSIEMSDADWEQLRHQARHNLDLVGATCNVSGVVNPYTYFPADVFINGLFMAQVGVRKKGLFGSSSEERPSLKIKFSEYVEEQRFLGRKRMTLNNNISDPSQIKQCLGYSLFAEAGVAVPRCNFARVDVNGVDLGIYTHVEPIEKAFLARHFSDDEGALYEGALTADFRPQWVNNFERKTNKENTDRSDLEGIVSALEADDGELPERLESVVDVESFQRFWAMEVLLMHADGYARSMNNFYLYFDPRDGRARFIPWGIDSILYPDRPRWWEAEVPPGVAWAEGALTRRLYLHDGLRERYLATMQVLLADVWDQDRILQRVDQMEGLLAPELQSASEAERSRKDRAMAELRSFIASRRDQVEELLREPAPTWDQPPRDSLCFTPIGTFAATFHTTWQSLQANPPRNEGQAEAILTLEEETHLSVVGESVAGADTLAGQPGLRLTFSTQAERTFRAKLSLDASWLEGPFPLERSVRPNRVAIFEVDSEGEETRLSMDLDCRSLRIDEALLEPSAPFSGVVECVLYPQDY